jgi:hypothetical protein
MRPHEPVAGWCQAPRSGWVVFLRRRVRGFRARLELSSLPPQAGGGDPHPRDCVGVPREPLGKAWK